MSKSICYVAILCIASLVVSSRAACPLGSVKIEQVPTGRSLEWKPEWKVSATSECRCALTLIKLMCPKFLSSIEVRPPVVSIDRDGHCIVKRENRNPLHYGESIHFRYAWDPIQFQVLHFNETCS